MSGRYALMWSGGKDSALALQRATDGGLAVTRLINFFDAATGRVRFHATRAGMIQAQAVAAGIELRVLPSLWPLWDRVTSSSLEFSGIRLRNAAPR